MPPSISFQPLAACAEASGTVVVIDVLRAFTTAAYALAAGAREIYLVGGIDEAFSLQREIPHTLIIGESDGLRVEGFDFGNSPSEISKKDLKGRHLIQRTSAGTQGIIGSRRAKHLVAASFCCARATARYITSFLPNDQITFIITGSHSPDHGEEDIACGEYIAALLNGKEPDHQPFLERAASSSAALKFFDIHQSEFPLADLKLSLAINRFNFAMPVHWVNGLFALKPFLITSLQ